MRLSEFASEMHGVRMAGNGDPEIRGIALDSRRVEAGFVFAALDGSRERGDAHIAEAVQRGAAALLLSSEAHSGPDIPRLVADNVRKALGEFADIFYNHPSRSLSLIGVTGTNGKTTTAYLLRHLFNRAGRQAGMLGTIEYDVGGSPEPAPLTTPDAVRFTRSLAVMRDRGCDAAVVEVSSHAMHQGRVWPHSFATAVFTNLTRDHLDYHGDMDAYLEAKRGLFLGLGEKAQAVFNYGDPAASRMAEGTIASRLGYCLASAEDGGFPEGLPAGTARATILQSDLDGQIFQIDDGPFQGKFFTPLVGRHNVENCLGAMLAGFGQGLPVAALAVAMADFPGVPGRLERLESPVGVRVFVDFAHTDDALRSVLSVLRPLVKGRLITVFGCGGDRDPGKRPMMARAAEQFSDRVVVTSDNPRTEDPGRIIDDIMPGFAHPERVAREADRPSAIRMAVAMAGADDAVLVAGKGHENYQVVGLEKRHMDDRELVRDAFAEG